MVLSQTVTLTAKLDPHPLQKKKEDEVFWVLMPRRMIFTRNADTKVSQCICQFSSILRYPPLSTHCTRKYTPC